MIIKTAHRAVSRLLCSYKIESHYHSFRQLEGDLLRQVTKVLIAYNKIICNAQNSSKDGANQSTLLTQLLSYGSQQQTNNNQLQKQALNYAQQFFTQGVDINTVIFNQSRIVSPKYANKNSRFIFTPTLSVTTPMFNVLNKKITNPYLIHGNYGVSKTTSIILYCHFSFIINRYLVNLQDKKSFLRELGEDRQYIPRKLFYWSFEQIRSDGQEEQQLERILLQAPELGIRDKNNIKQVGKKIKQKYQEKGIKCSIVFDQINSIISKYRDANYASEPLQKKLQELKEKNAQKEEEQSRKIDELDRNIKSTPDQQRRINYYNQMNDIFAQRRKRIQEYNDLKLDLKKVEEYVKPFKRADRFHQDLSICFSPPFYNSSVNYQDNILVSDGGKQYNLGFRKPHGQKFEQFIDYSTHLGKEIRKKELKEFLVRQLKSQLPTEYSKELTGLQSSIDAWDIYSYFVRPLTIFIAVEEMVKNIKGGKSFKQSFVELPQLIKKISNDHFQSRFFKFLKKQNATVRNKVVSLLLDHLIRSQRKDQDGQIAKIPLKELSSTNHLLASQLDKEIFKLDQSSLTVLIPIRQLKHLLMNNENQDIFLTLSHCTTLSQQFLKRSVFGSLLQDEFLLIFQDQYPIQLQLDKEKFLIEGSENLIQLPTKNIKDMQGLVFYFKGILNKCINHMNKWIFGFPITKQRGQDSQNSASIDFLIMRVSIQGLRIYSFDLTTNNSQSQLKRKMEQKIVIKSVFTKLLQDFPDFPEIIWQQTIVVSPAAFEKYSHRKYIENGNNLSHKMIDFRELKVFKSNSNSTKPFYHGVELLNQELKNKRMDQELKSLQKKKKKPKK